METPYFSHKSVKNQVIGNTMLNSQRISELHARIGADMKLSERFGKLRLKHVGNDSLLVIDGTRVNCEADICVSAVGKNKDGGFSPQINLSIVTNASTSQVVSYRYYSGNTADVSTLSDFRTIFDDAELKKTRATILMDRGYDSTEEFIELDKSGYRFIVGTKTSYKPVKRLLEGERNNELFSPYSLLEKSNIYAIKGTDVITLGKDSMSLNLYLFRDPDRAASEGRKLVKCVEKFRKDLAEGNASLDEPMAKYFRNTKVGTRPQCIRETVDEDSYLKGVSSFVSNINYSTEEVFADYKLRNEAEVNFKSMFKNLFRSTRVHSTPALEGAMFTSFLALTALTDLRGRMQRPITAKKVRKGKDRRIEDYFTTAELLHEFDHIVLDHNASGSPRLIGVTEFDKELAADLGLPGIFDSAAEVEKALSAVGLANYLRDQKVSLKR